MDRKKRMKRNILLSLVAILGVLQMIPVKRSNPPAKGTLVAPPDVLKILRTSCYDCHSNETRWPWYSYIMPVSWLVSHDVDEGRAELNFSNWMRYDKKKQQRLKEEIWEEVNSGAMPLGFYLWMHSDAVLTDKQKARIKAWSNSP